MKRIAFGLAALAVAGCFELPPADDENDFQVPLVCGPEVDRPPCAAGAEPGKQYRFNLLTHCGIEWAYLDGHYWVPRPKIDPPSHWAAIEPGTIVLNRRDEAVFEAEEGGGARFVPAAEDYRPETCA